MGRASAMKSYRELVRSGRGRLLSSVIQTECTVKTKRRRRSVLDDALAVRIRRWILPATRSAGIPAAALVGLGSGDARSRTFRDQKIDDRLEP
jgi:hypothetical protein